ncbi:ATP-dependent helicase, partial [Klebsiella oxytoca]
LDSAVERATLYRNLLKRLIDTTIAGYSYWFESYGSHFLLAITPLSVADKFRELIKSHKSSWIFTSATLSVDEKMSYYTDRLGLENATTLILNSPFDYQHQTLLCVPR